MPQDLFDALNGYLESLAPRPSESEVLRLALQRDLESVGWWPPPGEKHR
jgi:hypothetical protein